MHRNRGTARAVIFALIGGVVGVGVDQLLKRAFGVSNPFITGATTGGFPLIGIGVANLTSRRRAS